MHFFTHPTPFARLRAFLRLTGLPPVLPEWAYGHWKSRDVYDHQRDAEADYDGYREHGIPLDAIVLDSPWATQYNTWEFNPHQFPDAAGMIARWRADGVRTVVWVAPWVNLDSRDGQYPPDDESGAAAPRARAQLRAGDVRPRRRRRAARRALVDGHGLAGRLHQPARRGVVARAGQARAAARRRRASRPTTARAGTSPTTRASPTGRPARRRAWGHGLRYRRSMQRALDEVHPGEGVLFGRPGWTGQQAVGITWGGDQPSDFWSLRTLVAATLTAAASGFRNWSHDVGGYLGERLVARCPKELLLRWVQFGCFTPLMHAHARFEQEAWTYDEETLEVYRAHVLLHERLVPYMRAAAATAARCGLPIIRPLALTDPADARGWAIADAYGYGPSLWVAPVLEDGAREVEVDLPARRLDRRRGTGAEIAGGGTVVAPAPLDRIPVWVRRGALIVTYPADARRARAGRHARARAAAGGDAVGRAARAAVPPPGWPTARSCATCAASGASRPARADLPAMIRLADTSAVAEEPVARRGALARAPEVGVVRFG